MNRYPIQTEVHTFNEEVITDAINFEMSRNGQVFFVNNRIANQTKILRLIDDDRIGIRNINATFNNSSCKEYVIVIVLYTAA